MTTTSTASTTPKRKFVTFDVTDPAYNIAKLLDHVTSTLGIKNDAALSRELGVPPPVVSKIRNAKVVLSAAMMVRIHDATNMPIAKIRSFLTGPAN